jgi:hypothetical protein
MNIGARHKILLLKKAQTAGKRRHGGEESLF